MSDSLTLTVGPTGPAFQELDRVRSRTNPSQVGTALSIRPAGGLRVMWDGDREAQTERDEDVEFVERARRQPLPRPAHGLHKGADQYMPTYEQATDRDPHPDTPAGQQPPARRRRRLRGGAR